MSRDERWSLDRPQGSPSQSTGADPFASDHKLPPPGPVLEEKTSVDLMYDDRIFLLKLADEIDLQEATLFWRQDRDRLRRIAGDRRG